VPKITSKQLFSLIILFEIGSAIIFPMGIDAKQDAWIADLVALLIGFVLMWIYTELQKKFPDKNLAQITMALMGKVIGIPIALTYSIYFFYISLLNIIESEMTIRTTFLQDTPRVVIIGIFIATLLYLLWLGIDILSKIAELFLPYLLFVIIAIFVLVFFSGRINIQELTPVLGNDVLTILKAAFPVASFPFGEAVVFLMFFSLVDNKVGIRKISFIALGISGLIITFASALMVSVLGVHYTSIAEIPLLKVIKLINIGDILTNLDSLGIVFIFITTFFKSAIFFYAGVSCICSIFNKNIIKWLLILCGIIMLPLSIFLIPNYATYLVVGPMTAPKYISPVILYFLTPLLLLISYFKKVPQKHENT
jgi:spore germination protein KB